MSNVAENPPPRATVQKVGPDGHMKTFASGPRNAVGIGFYPGTNDLYVTVNERGGLNEFEMLHRVGDKDPPAIDASFAECLVVKLTRRTDKRFAREVFVIARLPPQSSKRAFRYFW